MRWNEAFINTLREDPADAVTRAQAVADDEETWSVGRQAGY